MEYEFFGMQLSMKKIVLAVIILISVFVSGVIGFMISQANNPIIVEKQQNSGDLTDIPQTDRQIPDEKDSKPDESSENEIDQIKVYVVGCVKKPGIVTLKKGQLIDDAVKAAGGVTQEADLENINMAYELTENVMLKIKSKKQTAASAKKPQPEKTPASFQSGVEIVQDSRDTVVDEVKKEEGKSGKLNLNTASANDLDTLPGIGVATANDIIAYREKSGPFKKIEDIMKVPRIKESRFNAIKDLITVE